MLKMMRAPRRPAEPGPAELFDNGTWKVVILASAIIGLAVVLTGTLSSIIAERALVQKLKSKDLLYIAESITAKINGRIERAKETALLLARDPGLNQWVAGREQDRRLGEAARTKLADVAENYDYDNSFVVSAVTGHYWDEKGRIIDTMNPEDPDDSWFFATLAAGRPVSIVIDSNNERGSTFVFVNALMGDVARPSGISGVGLDLRDISREFQSYKFGSRSNLWLVDRTGRIYISEDTEHLNRNIGRLLPAGIRRRVLDRSGADGAGGTVLSYRNDAGLLYDLITLPIRSADWKLVFQIPRRESIAIAASIKFHTALAGLIMLVLIVLLFYWVSRKIADPYQRAVRLSKELEAKVAERTRELDEQNRRMKESIEYARIIQESILPSPAELAEHLGEHFLIWRPRDLVSGDFYWVKRLDRGVLLAVGDCAGHGVPGALLTMTVHSILNQIVADRDTAGDPALILAELDRVFEATMRRGDAAPSGAGLDIGLVHLGESEVLFAGARTVLYLRTAAGLQMVKGNPRSIGQLRRSGTSYQNQRLARESGAILYLGSDGLTDQNGGERDLPYGRKRLAELVNECYSEPLERQGQRIEAELRRYMDGREQRDDITLVGVRL
jgi:serine phosphatase RsbU (regulator of sigma subunit)